MPIFGRCKKIFCSFILLFSVMLLVVVPFISLDRIYPGFLQHLVTIITQHQIIFICFRGILLLILFLSWTKFIRLIGQKKAWSLGKTDFWIRQRFKLFVWLILFELFINAQFLLVLMHLGERI